MKVLLHHGFTAAWAASTRPIQDQTKQNGSMSGGRDHEVLWLSEKLLVRDGCWERGSQFTPGMQTASHAPTDWFTPVHIQLAKVNSVT